VPESSGCFEFAGWSDGGEATHAITVPEDDVTYTATFTDACPPLVASFEFSEGQGLTAFDASGYGNHAALRGDATFGPGRIGGGLALDGAGDFAAIADSPSLAFGNQITVAGWVRRTSAPAGWHHLVSRQQAGSSTARRARASHVRKKRSAGRYRAHAAGSSSVTNADQFLLAFNGATPYFGVRTPSGFVKAGSGSTPLGQWVHLAGTYNGSRVILYVNGTERARIAKSGPVTDSGRPVLIGANANTADPLAASEFLAGGLDDVRIFSRALSASEIAALASGL
jgi:Concanavalin A-like lectin/glucanases superfamily